MTEDLTGKLQDSIAVVEARKEGHENGRPAQLEAIAAAQDSFPTTDGFPIACSKTLSKLMAALARAQLKYTPAFKNTQNPYFESIYADLSSIMDATRDALATEGLSISQWPTSEGKEAGVINLLMHESGEWMAAKLLLPATGKARRSKARDGDEEQKPGTEKFDAQTVGAAVTYARRYMWQGSAGVAAEIETDANELIQTHTEQAQAAVAAAKTAGIEVSLYYRPFEESGTYQIVGNQDLKASNRDLLKPFWNATAGALVVNDDQLEALKFEFEKRGVPFRLDKNPKGK
jgi:hypothetical protein